MGPYAGLDLSSGMLIQPISHQVSVPAVHSCFIYMARKADETSNEWRHGTGAGHHIT